MRFFMLIVAFGLIGFAAILSMAVSVNHLGQQRPLAKAAPGPWVVLLAAVAAGDPSVWELTPAAAQRRPGGYNILDGFDAG